MPYGLGLSGRPNASGVLVVSTVVPITDKLCYSSFHPVPGPSRILAVAKCIPEVVYFLVEKLWLTAYHPCPVSEGINDTILG